ncbi:MAG: ABC transporter ATP-binding protein [Deltaproteobacteria bacterium]|nr:ABC transporter ATP-binding protein [Deltaproteobacteria bacterium]MBW2017134.1 ABC transporter ATP-binding protein [Deltaproteobacteria bacterium]MBW2304126.1 ABC transporter ATP-binding protein [Deltaproteobacteria bacterium]
MLKITGVTTYYGPIRALKDISIEVGKREIVCLLGGNASGKSTTMKTILGIVKPVSGQVEFRGERIDGLPTYKIVRKGISPVPEARRVFARLTVRENLEMGGFIHRRNPAYHLEPEMERVFALFPRLKERLNQDALTLSGGEQQMLAIGRALMAKPRMIIMDEPSMGLSPKLVDEVFGIIREVSQIGIPIFVVEQNLRKALSIADRGYILNAGEIVLEDSAQNLLENENVIKAYLGEE